MFAREKRINVTVFFEEKEYHLTTFQNEYSSLMMLIYDKLFLDDFGECRGMGKCGTCLIEVIECPTALTFHQRNEEVTINKAGITDSKVRLSCQILIDENLDKAQFKIIKIS